MKEEMERTMTEQMESAAKEGRSTRRVPNLIPAVILILLGVTLLLNNLGIIDFDWRDIWRFWPVMLIIAGLGMLGRNARVEIDGK